MGYCVLPKGQNQEFTTLDKRGDLLRHQPFESFAPTPEAPLSPSIHHAVILKSWPESLLKRFSYRG
jgi:hypothetical protein